MTLHTAMEGMIQGLKEPLLDMQHLVFCLLLGLVLFTLRRKPRDTFYYIGALFPGYALERFQSLPPLLINAGVALTLVFVLFQEWIYEKLASYTLAFLGIAGFLHGLSLSREATGSSTSAFLAYTLTATLVQALLIYGFGLLSRRVSLQSPDGFEGLENILSAVGVGVALAYFVLAF
jgi:hydrogenase/urease accessory protein HupE